MQPTDFKSILAALVLPPAFPLIVLVLAGAFAVLRARRFAATLAVLATAALWWVSTPAAAAWLAATLLPQAAALAPKAGPALAAGRVQAIVVLGGGVLPLAPEFGEAEPSAATLVRLRYGAHLAWDNNLPLAFAGGLGRGQPSAAVAARAPTRGASAPAGAAPYPPAVTEAQAAEAVLADWGIALKWKDASSRDTAENAENMHRLLAPEGITHIALVTHAWHMPRAQKLFERAGFAVLPAPTGFVQPGDAHWLGWVPSAGGLSDSRAVLREWLALMVS